VMSLREPRLQLGLEEFLLLLRFALFLCLLILRTTPMRLVKLIRSTFMILRRSRFRLVDVLFQRLLLFGKVREGAILP